MGRKELHLIVTYRWYDEWLNGDKNEEYRKMTSRYMKILGNLDLSEGCDLVLHRGYTSTTQRYPIEWINAGFGKQEWGAPADDCVFIIKCKK